MTTIRELAAGESDVAYTAMRELRAGLESAEDFGWVVDEVMRPQGYRLVAAFGAEDPEAVAVAGFRVSHNLVSGRFLYIDDLVTRSSYRGAGHARALLDWVTREGRQLGCAQLHLDSGAQRYTAHRFYLSQRMDISGFHFAKLLSRD